MSFSIVSRKRTLTSSGLLITARVFKSHNYIR
jgi:hypothetical protein